MDSRNSLLIKVDALTRLCMINSLSGLLPLYIVTEYPKSGGTWISQVISKYLDLDFPRNRMPRLRPSLMHCHLQYSPFMKNVICVLRDGRDVMVSLYYHMLFENDKNSPLLVNKTRMVLNFENFDDIKKNLAEFICYVSRIESNSLSPYKFTWGEFVKSWENKDIAFIKYEDAVIDTVSTVAEALRKINIVDIDYNRLNKIVDEYSFVKQANRKPGLEDKSNFLRKGTPGDWREKFDRKSANEFNDRFGSELISLGYENNNDWVNSFSF